MFEHLSPPSDPIKSEKFSFNIYLVLLLIALFVFVSSLVLDQVPSTEAFEESLPKVTILADSSNQILTLNTPKVTVFDLVVDTDKAGVLLGQLKFYVDGLYDPAIFNNLKLYHNGNQLGQISKLDDQGHIYFEIDNYVLPLGQNEFSIVLTSTDSLSVDDILQFSLEDKHSVVLSYHDSIFTPEGNFPVKSGVISFLNKGKIAAYNNLPKEEFLIPSNDSQKLADFIFNSAGETADLKKIVIDYQTNQDLDLKNSVFTLVHNDKTVAIAKADKNKITFVLDRLVVLGVNKNTDLQLYVTGLDEGNYNFYLEQAMALGYVSGEEINYDSSLFLSKIHSLNAFPKLTQASLPTELSAGWNILFDLNIAAQGSDNINLNELNWKIGSYGTAITDVEVWVNDEFTNPTVEFNKNNISVRWENGLNIPFDKTNIQLLAKVGDLEGKANLEAYLTDDPEGVSWFYDGRNYNASFLPDLPLDPVVLTN